MSNNLANRKIFLNKKQKHIRLRRHKNYLDAKLHQRSFLGNTKKENEQHRNFNQCDATTNIENIFTDNLKTSFVEQLMNLILIPILFGQNQQKNRKALSNCCH